MGGGYIGGLPERTSGEWGKIFRKFRGGKDPSWQESAIWYGEKRGGKTEPRLARGPKGPKYFPEKQAPSSKGEKEKELNPLARRLNAPKHYFWGQC